MRFPAWHRVLGRKLKDDLATTWTKTCRSAIVRRLDPFSSLAAPLKILAGKRAAVRRRLGGILQSAPASKRSTTWALVALIVIAGGLGVKLGTLMQPAQQVLRETTPITIAPLPRHLSQKTSHATPKHVPSIAAPAADQAGAWPLAGPVDLGYGWVPDPLLHGAFIFHQGWDLGGNVGQPVLTPFAGKVLISGDGNVTLVAGDVTWRLGGLGSETVAVGDRLKAMDEVGFVGAPAAISLDASPHVSVTIWRAGKAVSPGEYLTPRSSK